MTTPLNWHAETFERVHDTIIHLRDTLPNRRSMLWFAVAPKDKDRIMDMYGLFNPQWRGFQYDVDELYLALQQLEAQRAAAFKEQQEQRRKLKREAKKQAKIREQTRSRIAADAYAERIGDKYKQQ